MFYMFILILVHKQYLLKDGFKSIPNTYKLFSRYSFSFKKINSSDHI